MDKLKEFYKKNRLAVISGIFVLVLVITVVKCNG